MFNGPFHRHWLAGVFSWPVIGMACLMLVKSFTQCQVSHTGNNEALVSEGVSPAGKNLGFEKGNLEGWTQTGNAWEGNPIEGDTVASRRPGQRSRHVGNFWVGGYERSHSDAHQGVLQSAPFRVTHPWGSFLVGGGSAPSTRVEILLVSDESVLIKASGDQAEDMQRVVVDLRDHIGQEILIRVIDESAGFWGHINYDDFRFHAVRPTVMPRRIQENRLLTHLKPNSGRPQDHQTINSMWVPEGFQVDLIASEPELTQPIAFTFDEQGRMWIAEAHSYPRRQAEGQGKDRIIILEDSDGDGDFETKKIFAEGLNLVSGLEVGFGGVWVGAAPEFLFLPDQDGDDVMDSKPEILLDGWGYQDTHETLNSFIWGPDGWLYGNQGVFNHSLIGKPGASQDERVEMRAGVWRYHPQRHEFEIYSTGCSNQWGIDFNELGHLFITHCRSAWGGGPTSYMIQGGHYWNQSNAFHAPFIAAGKVAWNPGKEPIFRNFLPSSARYGHGEGGAGEPGSRALYGGHSHVGAMIYLGSNWPETYRNQLFTHNLHGHQMNRQQNVRLGSGYETFHAGADQFFTTDRSFVGVDLKYGPDGAVYMIDWSDHQHCHTTNVERWDRSTGRLYRMQWVETFQPVKINLKDASNEKLVSLVTSKDEWVSRTARRLLQERKAVEVLPMLDKQLFGAKDTPETLRLLWTRYVISGGIPFDWAWSHEEEAVRSWAVSLSLDSDQINVAKLIEMAENEPSSMVRLALSFALQKIDSSARWRLAEILGNKSEDQDDRYVPGMIWYGLASVVTDDMPRALALAHSTPMPVLSDSIVWYLSKFPEGRNLLVAALQRSTLPPDRSLKLMSEALMGNTALAPPESWFEVSLKLKNTVPDTLMDHLRGIFGDAALLVQMRATLANTTASLAERKKALQFMRDSGDTACAKELIIAMEHAALRPDVIPLLARFNRTDVADALLTYLPRLEGEATRNALVVLSSKPKLAKTLLSAAENDQFDVTTLSSFHVRQMRSLKDESLNRMLEKTWGKSGDTLESIQESILKYKKLYREAPLWAHKRDDGKELFELLCLNCHVLNGEGSDLGPDLTGAWRNGVDYFLENIVDPDTVVGENYQLNLITLKNGDIFSGIFEQKTERSLRIRTVTESITLPHEDIESREISTKSMMPSGLLEALSDKQVIDLLKFLSTP